MVLVQSNSSGVNSGASTALAFSPANVAGNLLVVKIVAQVLSTMSDSAGNVYQNVSYNSGTSGFIQAVYYCFSAKGGANTVTATGTGVMMTIEEYNAGTNYSFTALDGAAVHNDGVGAPSAASITTTNATDLLLVCGVTLTYTPSAGSGYTKVGVIGTTGLEYGLSEYQFTSTTGTYTVTFNASGSNTFSIIGVAIKAVQTTIPIVAGPITAIENTGASSPAATIVKPFATQTTISIVQSADNNGAGTTLSVALPNPVGANNLLVISASYEAGTVNPTISGNNNTFIRRGTTNATGMNAAQWDVLSANPGPTTITLNFSVSQTWIEIAVYEVNSSDGAPWNFEMGSGAPNSGTSTAPTTGTIGPAVPNQICIAYACPQNGTITAGSGGTWTYVATAGGGGREYIVNTTLANRTPTFTASQSTLWVAIAGAWYPTPSVPTVLAQQTALLSQTAQNPTVSPTYQVIAGDLLVLFFNWGNVAGAVSGVTDSLGNAWTQFDFQQTSARTLYCFAAKVTNPGACTITVATDASRAYLGVLYEVSGALPALDGAPVHNSSATTVTSLATGTLTTNLQNDIVFAANRGGAISTSPAAPWTSTSSGGLGTAYQPSSMPAAFSTSWSFASSNAVNTILAFVASFRASNLTGIENTSASKPAAIVATVPPIVAGTLTGIENTKASSPTLALLNIRAGAITGIENTSASSPSAKVGLATGTVTAIENTKASSPVATVTFRASALTAVENTSASSPAAVVMTPASALTAIEKTNASSPSAHLAGSINLGTLQLSCLPASNALCHPSALSNPQVSMGSYRAGHAQLQPTQPAAITSDPNDPSWSWSYFDSGIAQAQQYNKGAFLRVLFQGSTPAWATANIQQFVPINGGAINIWWDSYFQSVVKATIQAVGARYGSNPIVKAVSFNIIAQNSGDWSFPHSKATWQNSASFVVPAVGATVNVTTTVNAGMGKNQYCYIPNAGWFQATQASGTIKTVLLNNGTAGNAAPGTTVPANTTIQLDDLLTLQTIYGYTTAKLVAAETGLQSVIQAAFPNAMNDQEVGRNGSMDPYPPSGQTYQYNAATQIAQAGFANEPKFCIGKNTVQVGNPPPATALSQQDGSDLYLPAQTLAGSTNTSGTTGVIPANSALFMQALWVAYDETGAYSPTSTTPPSGGFPPYCQNGGVAYTDPVPVVQGTISLMKAYAAQVGEIYQDDLLFALPILQVRALGLLAIENTGASTPAATVGTRASGLTAIENTTASLVPPVAYIRAPGSISSVENTSASSPAATAPNLAGALTAIENTKASNPTLTQAFRAGALTGIENTSASSPAVAAMGGSALVAIEHTKASSPAATAPNRAGTLTAIEKTTASTPRATVTFRASGLTAIENILASAPIATAPPVGSNLRAIENTRASSPAATVIILQPLRGIENTSASRPAAKVVTNTPILPASFLVTLVSPRFTVKQIFS